MKPSKRFIVAGAAVLVAAAGLTGAVYWPRGHHEAPAVAQPGKCADIAIPMSEYADSVSRLGEDMSAEILQYADAVAHPPEGMTRERAVAAAQEGIEKSQQQMHRELSDALVEMSFGGQPGPHTVGTIARPGCPPSN